MSIQLYFCTPLSSQTSLHLPVVSKSHRSCLSELTFIEALRWCNVSKTLQVLSLIVRAKLPAHLHSSVRCTICNITVSQTLSCLTPWVNAPKTHLPVSFDGHPSSPPLKTSPFISLPLSLCGLKLSLPNCKSTFMSFKSPKSASRRCQSIDGW